MSLHQGFAVWTVLVLAQIFWLPGNANAWQRGLEPENDYFVAECNPIQEIYVGETIPRAADSDEAGKTELVFELGSMHFYSNDTRYGCIFVSGQIVWIKEYNQRDSYVRGYVALPAYKDLVAYSGVIGRRNNKLDPFKHELLWQAFADSAHEPFRGKLQNRPKWFVNNPIRMKQAKRPLPAPANLEGNPEENAKVHRLNLNERDYPYLAKDEIPQAIAMYRDPLTGEMDRFSIVWGLAISGYTPPGAEFLAEVVANAELNRTWREYAAMGLGNFSGSLTPDERDKYAGVLRECLGKEEKQTPPGILRVLIGWGEVDHVERELQGKLDNHSMQVEILTASNRPGASDELWQLYQAIPAENFQADTASGKATRLGWALVLRHDKRGLGILARTVLVTAKDASAQQARINILQFVTQHTGGAFRFSGDTQPDAVQHEAERFALWWETKGQEFNFPR